MMPFNAFDHKRHALLPMVSLNEPKPISRPPSFLVYELFTAAVNF